jgi:hypothetical protein
MILFPGKVMLGDRVMIRIDGSLGEGGGQILRNSLSLSLATGKPFRIENIRAGRERPGLLRQHLTAVLAAVEVGGAGVEGATLGSTAVTFSPGKVRAGDYRFAVGTAGSGTLVLQTVLPALLTADAPSHIAIEGGTHNSAAPPFDFLDRAFLPLIERMGPKVRLQFERFGFYRPAVDAFVRRLNRFGLCRHSILASAAKSCLDASSQSSRTFRVTSLCARSKRLRACSTGTRTVARSTKPATRPDPATL